MVKRTDSGGYRGGGGGVGVITPPLVAENCVCSNSNFSPTGAITPDHPPPPCGHHPPPPPLQKILYPRLTDMHTCPQTGLLKRTPQRSRPQGLTSICLWRDPVKRHYFGARIDWAGRAVVCPCLDVMHRRGRSICKAIGQGAKRDPTSNVRVGHLSISTTSSIFNKGPTDIGDPCGATHIVPDMWSIVIYPLASLSRIPVDM